MNTYENKSEVVRTLEQIEEENAAARQALYGLALRTGRHDVTSKKQGHGALPAKGIAKPVVHGWEMPAR